MLKVQHHCSDVQNKTFQLIGKSMATAEGTICTAPHKCMLHKHMHCIEKTKTHLCDSDEAQSNLF